MSGQTIEKIDSSQMQVLADFRCVDEIVDGGAERYAIGVSGKNVFVRTTGVSGLQATTFFYERANHTELVNRIEDAFAGKLKDSAKDYFSIKQGEDSLIVRIIETFPHTSMKPLIKFKLTNNREANLDGNERGGWFLYMSVETGKKMLEEMKRIRPQVTN